MPGSGSAAAVSVSLPVTRARIAGTEASVRPVAVECPVAVEYNGLGYAVMMATPADLRDLAIGFTLTERLVQSRSDIIDVDSSEVELGVILRVTLASSSFAPLAERVRHRISESGCGLCGVENLEQALRPLPRLTKRPVADRAAVFRALAAVADKQPLNRETGGVHAAAFCSAAGDIMVLREDVGRHNALDKLIGALDGVDPASGFILVTSRCSYELVEKTVIAGCPMLAAISAPTSLAIERAESAGLTLVALARPDTMLVVNDPYDLNAPSA